MGHGKNMDTLLFLVLLWLLFENWASIDVGGSFKHCMACKLREDGFGRV